MIETVFSAELPVAEHLLIRKHRVTGTAPRPFTDENGAAPDLGHRPRIAVVTGIHGDELEGQYICYEVARRIREHPEHLAGIVDVYPALNPLGVGTMTRGIPLFDLDMNRIFPGNNPASPYESIAADVVADISGATLCFDIHSSNVYLRELPQVRVNEITADSLLPWARESNVDFVWVHGDATVLRGTLAYSLNALGTPCLVVELGVGLRVTKDYGRQMADGIMHLLAKAGVWNGPAPEVREPIVGTDSQVSFVNAGAAGLFVPAAEHGKHVTEGQLVGRVVDPPTGTVLEDLRSPCTGLLFTLREYPMVYPGSLVARVLGGAQC